MARSALVDAGFLVALLSRRDGNHGWAAEQASRFPPPWMTCEAVLFAGADGLCGCLSRSHDRARERSHVIDNGCRLPDLHSTRSADDSMHATALKPAQRLERTRGRRIH
jgi:hypothetical protein